SSWPGSRRSRSRRGAPGCASASRSVASAPSPAPPSTAAARSPGTFTARGAYAPAPAPPAPPPPKKSPPPPPPPPPTPPTPRWPPVPCVAFGPAPWAAPRRYAGGFRRGFELNAYFTFDNFGTKTALDDDFGGGFRFGYLYNPQQEIEFLVNGVSTTGTVDDGF